MGGGTLGGFLDVVGAKGKDGFGDETKTEMLFRATYMLDVLDPKAGLKAGFGTGAMEQQVWLQQQHEQREKQLQGNHPVVVG